jgi:hypothetical protein
MSKFKEVLSSAGRAFLAAFAASALALTTGVLAAPNLDQAFALGVAALFASVAAGVKAVQEYVPQLSVGEYVSQPLGAWIDAFIQGAVGALVISIPGVLNAPELGYEKAAIVAVVVGALQAGFRALQGVATKGESPAPATGA